MTGCNCVEELADRAIWGEALDPRFRQWELTAGVVTAALLVGAEEEPPADLLRRVRSDALAFLDRGERAEPGTTPAPSSWRPLAAAAVLVAVAAALSLWWSRPAPVPTAAERMAALIGLDAGDILRVEWQPGPGDPSGELRGEVVWSHARQEGYMRFVGLPANDPSKSQYQLWIFDRERSEAHPVDGGVFDIAPTSEELVVAIHAKIRVHDAGMFAVTLEEPGGVVVSEREQVVALASL